MMYFHTYKADPAPLNVDIVGDIRRLNDMSVKAKKAGMIVLGGGVCKHQIANAMLFRNGADYAVYINTGQEVSRDSVRGVCGCEAQLTDASPLSTTARTLARAPTRLCLGARSAATRRASRCMRTRRSCSRWLWRRRLPRRTGPSRPRRRRRAPTARLVLRSDKEREREESSVYTLH